MMSKRFYLPGFMIASLCLLVVVSNLIAQPTELSIDNNVLTVKLDLTRGGAISYISLSGSTRSLVNIADEGRYIQQSYYAGRRLDRKSEGQNPGWSPWSWNPIQVGDSYGNRAQILDYQNNGDTLYVKCIPMLWDMNNMPAEAEMEQWTILKDNMLEVHNKLTCFRTDDIYGENILADQELPAVYPISALKNLYSYLAGAPFSNAPVNKLDVVNLSSGFWGLYSTVTEHWMAFVDDQKWGMGVYNHSCTSFLAGMAGSPGFESRDGSTSYIAPIKKEVLNKNSTYEYVYFIIIGTVDEIRSKVNELEANQPEPLQINHWNFDTDDNLEGWIPNGSIDAHVLDGFLTLDITGADPFITQQEDLSISAKLNTLVVKMRNNTTDSHADFFFKSSLSPNTYSRIRFSIIPNDTLCRTYIVDLEEHPEWKGTIFRLRLDPVSDVSSGSVDIDYIGLESGISVVNAVAETPRHHELMQNYPNPFNSSTLIKFRLAYLTDVELLVFNIFGQTVKRLVNASMGTGAHAIKWDGTDQSGCLVSSGVYFICLKFADFAQVRKIIVQR